MLGIVRGKRITEPEFDAFFEGGTRAARSIYIYDSTGAIPTNLPYANSDGDPDFAVFGHEGTIRVKSDNSNHGANLQLFGYMLDDDGEVMSLDSRHILQKLINHFDSIGLKAMIGMELEFYLMKENPGSNYSYSKLTNVPNSNSIDDLNLMEDFFKGLSNEAAEQKISIQSLISESGSGQFEVTFSASDDLLLACDNFIFMKRLIRAQARKVGLISCFMAKPFTEESGSGLHVHISFYDKKTGKNIIAGNEVPELNTPCSKEALYIISGMIELMDESIAVFAPNANSYRRFKQGSFAPINKSWAANNRTVAIRLPKATDKSARIEHRVPGVDANPYLVVSVIMTAAAEGLKVKKMPPPFMKNSAYGNNIVQDVPGYWSIALREFGKSKTIPKYMGAKFHEVYLKQREFECSEFHKVVGARDYRWYLGVV